ncbi:MAG: glycosyltransferase family 4 protein [Actinomycetota bacterium]|nr:glycosyltransferase family 4 protein [Actinomycetota bacterium]
MPTEGVHSPPPAGADIQIRVTPRRALRIALLAPPWIPVPPPGYGGIEAVVALLCEGLVRRGHDVTLFAAPGSRSRATVCEVLPAAHPDEIGLALYEADHVARAFEMIEQAGPGRTGFDVIHDHSGFVALAMAGRIQVPMVHTLHGPFDASTTDFYAQHADKAHFVAISQAQKATAPAALAVNEVIHNPIDAAGWPYEPHKEDYLLWVGRMHETKGPHLAIAAAKRAGVPLVLAGPIQPGQEEYFQTKVAPQVDGIGIGYVGEVGGSAKADLIARSRALLMPIQWNEPFGMVMAEALACGTPVIAFPAGAAGEIVRDGITGYLVADEEEMAAAIGRLGALDPAQCRADVIARFDVDRIAAAYEGVYRTAQACAARVVASASARSVRLPALPVRAGIAGAG